MRAQRADRAVAIDAARQLDDEDEPAAAIAAGVLAGQLEPLDPGERRAVGRGGAGAAGSAAAAAIPTPLAARVDMP